MNGGFFYAIKVQNHTQQDEETITTVKQGTHTRTETHRRRRVSREYPRGRGGFLFTLVLEEQRLHQVCRWMLNH